MSKSTAGRRRAGLAAVATTALVAGACFAGAGAASASTDFKFGRIGGADRYATSALVAESYGHTADAILVNGEPGHYADALTANYLSGVKNAPVLLTRTDVTPDVVKQQLKDAGVKNVWIVGGEGVVSKAQADALAKDYTVNRVAGANRFETDKAAIALGGKAKRNVAVVATGFNFPDALAGGPIAYTGSPLALSAQHDIDNGVVKALQDAGISHAIILGGTDVVGPEVEVELKAAGITTDARLAGKDRAETSAMTAAYAVKNFGLSNTGADVASGYVKGYGADALAGGPLSGKNNHPLLVTKDVNIAGDAVVKYFKDNANTLKDGNIYGDKGAVSVDVESQLTKAAQSVTSNESYTVTPSGDTAKPASTTAKPDQGATTLTFSGLDNASRYDVALFPSSDVTTGSNGGTTFADNEEDGNGKVVGDNEADDQGSTETNSATITAVNNNTSGSTDQITPVNGSIQVTVNSDQVDSAVLVIFEDKSDDDTLDLDANNQPTEKFATSGVLSWTANEGTDAGYTAAVTSTDKANNQFTGDTDGDAAPDTFFNYDSNDQFTVNGAAGRSLSQFEDALNAGDVVDVNYNPDAAGVSTFDITTNATPAVSNVTASVTNADKGANANDVVINWTPGADTAPGTTYAITRYTIAPLNADGTCPAPTAGNTTAAGAVTDTTDTDTTATDSNVAPGCYAYKVVATSPNGDASDASDFSNAVQVAAPATADTTAPALSTAFANDVNDSVGSTNQVRFNFTEASGTVKVNDASKFTVTTGGLTFTGTSATVSGTSVIVTLDGTLNDATTDNTYTAAVAAGAVQDAAGNKNAAGTATFAY